MDLFDRACDGVLTKARAVCLLIIPRGIVNGRDMERIGSEGRNAQQQSCH
jgi:hypothetical protein